MLAFGVTVLYAGKVESVIFDKQTGIVGKVKTSIFCTKQQVDWSLDQIQNVRVYKRGHDGIQIMTIHYDVQIDFKDIPSTNILRSKDSEKAIRQMAQIKDFMGLPVNSSDLKYVDESTSRYDNRNRARRYEM